MPDLSRSSITEQSWYFEWKRHVSGAYMDGNTRLAVILKIIVYGLMLCAPSFLGVKKKDDRTIEEVATQRLSVVNIALWVLASQATIITRLVDIFAFLALGNYVDCVNDIDYHKNREVLIVISIVLFAAYGLTITLLKTPEWQTTYPFKWCF